MPLEQNISDFGTKNGRNWNVIEKKIIGDFEVRDVGSSAFSSIQEIKKRRVKTPF